MSVAHRIDGRTDEQVGNRSIRYQAAKRITSRSSMAKYFSSYQTRMIIANNPDYNRLCINEINLPIHEGFLGRISSSEGTPGFLSVQQIYGLLTYHMALGKEYADLSKTASMPQRTGVKQPLTINSFKVLPEAKGRSAPLTGLESGPKTSIFKVLTHH